MRRRHFLRTTAAGATAACLGRRASGAEFANAVPGRARDFDAIVIGSGPAGALAARELARAGRTVGLFDAAERGGLNKAAIVEVERPVFALVGTRPPEGGEIPYHGTRTRVFSAGSRELFVLDGLESAALRLDEFSRRLTAEAEAAGAKFFGGYRAVEPLLGSGAVRGVRFERGGAREEVTARVTIDATGNEARLTRGLAVLGLDFVEEQSDRVFAANCLHTIDREAAAQAVRDGKAADGEIWNRIGVYGNYSTQFTFLDIHRGRAYILIGHGAVYPNPPVLDLIDRVRRSAGYFREELSSGGGVIRVRRSLDRMVADGFMAVGEAACTVIPMHGSGVASAMLTGWKAGKVAAEAIDRGRTDVDALWPYAAWYQRGRGAILAGQDASRRITASLTPEQLNDLMESGAMTADDMRNALATRSASLSLDSLPVRLKALALKPGLTPAIARVALRVTAAERHYRKYPLERNEREFAAWKRGAEKIFRGL